MRLRSVAVGALALGGLLLGACGSSEPPEPSGRITYERYCAPCHGLAGLGDGPVARSLHSPPADLTLISERRGGKWDESWVVSVIDGRQKVGAHGPRDMPVWGSVFESDLTQEGHPYPRYTTFLKVRDLSDYLRSIQRKH